MNGSWNNPYDKERSDINDCKNAQGRRMQDSHPTVFPRVSIYARKDKALYCVSCKHQSGTNMEHVAHLQSQEHMDNLYKYKGSGASKSSRVKKEYRKEADDGENGEGENGEAAEKDGERKSRKRRSDSDSDDDRKRRRKSKHKKKDKKRRKKKKKKRYYSSSDSYSDSDSEDAADKEAKYDAAKRAQRLSNKFAGGKKTPGLAAEVRIAVAQAEARARDLAKKEDEELARNTNVFGKAQDRIKDEADKEGFGKGRTEGFVKTEAELLSYTEHKKQRGDDDDDDFIKKLAKDKDLMDSDEEDFGKDVHDEAEYEKDEVEIIPEKIEAKPRTKLSFIAPRIPVNRKVGFGTNAFQAQQGVSAGGFGQTKSAGGINIKSLAQGGAAITTQAAFAGSTTFQDFSTQQQALELSQQITSSFHGAHEIHATMQARAREHELQNLNNLKSEEAKLAKNAVKMNILDSFKQLRLPIPDFAALGLEPIPCGMAMPGYAYDVGADGNEVGTEIDGHDCFDTLDIKVY